MSSPPAWLDLWAFARIRMGLSKEEFFSLTPRAFVKMHEIWLDGQRDVHRMMALLRVDMINHSFYRPSKPLELADLMPAPGRPPVKKRRLTRKFRGEIADSFRAMFSPPAGAAGEKG